MARGGYPNGVQRRQKRFLRDLPAMALYVYAYGLPAGGEHDFSSPGLTGWPRSGRARRSVWDSIFTERPQRSVKYEDVHLKEHASQERQPSSKVVTPNQRSSGISGCPFVYIRAVSNTFFMA